LPDNLKSGIEHLSGIDISDVKVHYNSQQPAQLNAHAFAQGNQIHVASGQEKHLPHETWHVVQQKQGRVKPTKQLKSSVAINDDAGLEKEADVMGRKAIQTQKNTMTALKKIPINHNVSQLAIDLNVFVTKLRKKFRGWTPQIGDAISWLYDAIDGYNHHETSTNLNAVMALKRSLKARYYKKYGEALAWLDSRLESEAMSLAHRAPLIPLVGYRNPEHKDDLRSVNKASTAASFLLGDMDEKDVNKPVHKFSFASLSLGGVDEKDVNKPVHKFSFASLSLGGMAEENDNMVHKPSTAAAASVTKTTTPGSMLALDYGSDGDDDRRDHKTPAAGSDYHSDDKDEDPSEDMESAIAASLGLDNADADYKSTHKPSAAAATRSGDHSDDEDEAPPFHKDSAAVPATGASSHIISTTAPKGNKKKDKKKSSLAESKDDFFSIAKVGLELTFQNKQTSNYLKNDGFPMTGREAAKRWWEGMIEGWEGEVEEADGLECDTNKDEPNKDFGGDTGSMNTLKVTYSKIVNSTAAAKPKKVTVFWYQVSMDPGVVEIQTYPVTGKNMESKEINGIMSSIYKIAGILKLTPGGGGGHLNVDFATGVGKNYGMIPKILLATDLIVKGLTESDEHKLFVDVGNEPEDPFISTARVKKMKTDKDKGWSRRHSPEAKEGADRRGDWESDVYRSYAGKIENQKTLLAFRKAHAEWLHLYPTYSQFKNAESRTGKFNRDATIKNLCNVLHYQAVNIDHLFKHIIDETDGDIKGIGVKEEADPSRRLEFRFLRGQETVKEIIEGIKLIGMIISKAKIL
jgi:hypothetical protein